MEMKMQGLYRILLALTLMFGAIPLQAEMRVDVTEGTMQPMPIAVLPFSGNTAETSQMGQNIASVISNDLESSGLFKPIDSSAFIQSQPSQEQIRFADWRAINAQALLKGQVQQTSDGRMRVEFRLFDVYSERQLIGYAFTATSETWRRIAHKVADQVYQRLSGESGYFDTKIIYVSRVKTGKRRVERLAIMDQDGANHRILSDGRALVLTPRLSPNLDLVAYLNFLNRKPNIYLMKMSTQQNEILGHFPGMTYAPRFSPDGSKLIMSYALEGTSSLYLMDLASRQVNRLTQEDGVIDVSPCFSPDGSQIVFVSDRGGKPQIYVMGTSDLSPRQISQGEGKYFSPVWSPRGDLIVFVKQHHGIFYIGVMKTDGSDERMITQGYMVDSPTWSPNGRVIMFTREDRSGQAKLHTIDITGYNERVVPTPHEAITAAWSPLIP